MRPLAFFFRAARDDLGSLDTPAGVKCVNFMFHGVEKKRKKSYKAKTSREREKKERIGFNILTWQHLNGFLGMRGAENVSWQRRRSKQI